MTINFIFADRNVCEADNQQGTSCSHSKQCTFKRLGSIRLTQNDEVSNACLTHRIRKKCLIKEKIIFFLFLNVVTFLSSRAFPLLFSSVNNTVQSRSLTEPYSHRMNHLTSVSTWTLSLNIVQPHLQMTSQV